MNMMLKGRFTSPRHIPSGFSASWESGIKNILLCQPVLRAQDLLLSRELSYQYTTGIFLIVKKRLILYKLGEQNVDKKKGNEEADCRELPGQQKVRRGR